MHYEHSLVLRVNGRRHATSVAPRLLLSDFLRDELNLTGTHVGCEHGVCGACTVLLDGQSVRSCLILAVQAHGCEVETVESFGDPENLSIAQRLFQECHALQCGFCTPGFLASVEDMLRNHPPASETEVRELLSGNLCRCTGYQNIVAAVLRIRDGLASESAS